MLDAEEGASIYKPEAYWVGGGIDSAELNVAQRTYTHQAVLSKPATGSAAFVMPSHLWAPRFKSSVHPHSMMNPAEPT